MKDRYDDIDEYIGDLQAEIRTNDQCATHYYNLGVALLAKGDFVEAEEAFLSAVRNSPRLAEAYVQLGGSACAGAIWTAVCGTTKKRPTAEPNSPCRGATSGLCICSAAT